MTTAGLTPDELLTTTRSVRRRLDLTRPVPTELIRECVQIALQAPSGSNRQGWHWLVVTDQEQRRRIGEFYQRAVQRYLASAGSAARLFADDPERAAVQQRVGASVAWLGERMGQVPVLVIPCLRTGPLPAGNQAGLWGSLLPAAWSYMLAARPRARLGLDNPAPALRAGDRRVAGRARPRTSRRAHPHGVLHRRDVSSRPL